MGAFGGVLILSDFTYLAVAGGCGPRPRAEARSPILRPQPNLCPVPRRDDLKKILIIGSGPIVIGQACEFDYSGTQACKALREEGYEVVLVNSNPATIMTDPATADRTYIEPLTWEIVAKVIEKERPDALLPTLGGQTGLNVAMDLWRHGVLEKYGVEMIGANADVIDKAENRERFQTGDAQDRPRSGPRQDGAKRWTKPAPGPTKIGLPAVVRPSFTMGGSGSAIAYSRSEYDELVRRGLDQSPTTQVLIEESIIGWKEYEMEVMRDKDDNVVIICSIENFDPMGIHTGDSITVAPTQTLDRQGISADARRLAGRDPRDRRRDGRVEHSVRDPSRDGADDRHRDESAREPLERAGVEGDRLPDRQDRGEAGRRLPAARAAERHHPRDDGLLRADDRLRGDEDAAVRVREISRGRPDAHDADEERRRDDGHRQHVQGIVPEGAAGAGSRRGRLRLRSARPVGHRRRAERRRDRRQALEAGGRAGVVSALRVQERHERRRRSSSSRASIRGSSTICTRSSRRRTMLRGIGRLDAATDEQLRTAKRQGFSDRQLARIFGRTEMEVRAERLRRGIRATFKSVDTCAAEFEAYTPYYYSTYEDEDEVPPKPPGKKRIMILGGGPNRIGQGIEFDYCCCHASFALRELGIESVMVNSNPETVSTDYDTSDMLFFEPLTVEDVLNICDVVQPDGVIVQFGGQTPLNLARRLQEAGVPIIGTSVDAIEAAEDREKFQQLLHKLGPQAAAQRHRPHDGRGPPRGGEDRLSALGAAELRARRPGDGDLLRPGADGALRGRGVHRGRGAAGADRSLPRRGDRGRRRLHQRRQGRDRRRHHGAHRRGGRSLGRLGLCDSAVQPAGPGGGGNPRGDGRAGARSWASSG